MEALLDLERGFDVALLDNVVSILYTTSGEDQVLAQEVLTKYQDHPDAWTTVPDVVEQSSNLQTRYIGLQILDKLITTRWNSLADSQRQGIRNFVVSATVKGASDEATLRREKTLINKLNLTLVQILKQDWPHKWPKFITELIKSSGTNICICENNMVILRLLSEEIFDFSAEQMTQNKIDELKQQMCSEFEGIFKLCSSVLQNAAKPSLVKATLETLLRFLNWMPLDYIFETTIVNVLITRFLESSQFRNVTLKCLAEIATLGVGADYDPKFMTLFSNVMAAVNRMIPPDTDIAEAYEKTRDAGKELILNIALFIANFLTKHVSAIEANHSDILINANFYMVKISQVEEREVFKICLEYWLKLASELYDENQFTPADESKKSRKDLYGDILANLRVVVVRRMAKPEEVLIIENEEGEIVREFMKEADTFALYKQMRELLVYLTHLDITDTEAILSEELTKQVESPELSWQELNTLCWAIGSISGAMDEEREKRFIIFVLKGLLGLSKQKSAMDDKAVIASNLMYIVGQYPRFLKAHWKFHKVVLNKLFEFMHEKHEGVQDMACDTFLKIAQKCRRHLAMQQPDEREPFVEEILRLFVPITSDLSDQQLNVFYEAVGYVILAQSNKSQRDKLIEKLMEPPNKEWDSLMSQAANGVDVLADVENVRNLSKIIKNNVAACTSIGAFYLPQLGRIFLDMLGLYRTTSGIISEMFSRGEIKDRRKMRRLRIVKKEILKLIETFIENLREPINDHFLTPLLDTILSDYGENVPMARDAEVLNITAIVMERFGPLLTDKVLPILTAVFEPTLEMIDKNFFDYPDHRVGFYKLLREINSQCFKALLETPHDVFKLFIDSIVWAIKHTMRDIADAGLNLCLEVINNFDQADQETLDVFSREFFLYILQDVFFVLTDTEHKCGFRLQSQLLARMYQLVETGRVKMPLFDSAVKDDPDTTNAIFLRVYTANLLKGAFPHVKDIQLQTFIDNLSQQYNNINQFKSSLRDFLIQLKEFSGDHSDLFLEEREAAAQKKMKEEHDTAMRIPGMLKPSQIEIKEEEM